MDDVRIALSGLYILGNVEAKEAAKSRDEG